MKPKGSDMDMSKGRKERNKKKGHVPTTGYFIFFLIQTRMNEWVSPSTRIKKRNDKRENCFHALLGWNWQLRKTLACEWGRGGSIQSWRTNSNCSLFFWLGVSSGIGISLESIQSLKYSFLRFSFYTGIHVSSYFLWRGRKKDVRRAW